MLFFQNEIPDFFKTFSIPFWDKFQTFVALFLTINITQIKIPNLQVIVQVDQDVNPPLPNLILDNICARTDLSIK